MWAVLREGWARRPERVALCHLDGSGSLTYRQLDEAVGRRADLLDGAGLGSGSRLGVAVASPHEVVLAVLAGTACGADVAVFNPGWWPRELRPALELAGPDLTVAGGELAAIAADIGPVCTPEEAVEGPGGWARLRLDVGGSRRRDGGYRDGTSRRRDGGHGDATSDATSERAGGGLLCFTAGVWGEPSAYRFDAGQLAEHWLGPVESLDEGVTLLAGEIATAAGLRCALQVLAAGGQLVLGGRWAPARLARRLRSGGFDRVWAGAGQLNQLAARLSGPRLASGAPAGAGPSRRDPAFPTLRRVDAFGGPVHRGTAECFEALFGAPVLTSYALTESGGPATAGAVRTGTNHRPLDVGPARPGLHVDVVGPDGGPQPCDELGDIHLRGAALGRAPERREPIGGDAGIGPTAAGAAGATGHAAGHAWRRVPTGDWGRVDAGGHLHVVGRRRDRFECDGAEVWPQLVEQALAGDPRVADVAVAPRPDPRLGTLPVAVTVPSDPEHPPFLADLEAVLADLPEAWRPRAQAIVETLPLTATGQVHRRMLAYDEAAR